MTGSFSDFWLLFLVHGALRARPLPIKPSTILGFHQALKKRKYRLLYSSKRKSKPGPKGPSPEFIQLILEMRHRNPRFGTPRIALEIARSFGIDIEIDVYSNEKKPM